jgi:hypothetical protein
MPPRKPWRTKPAAHLAYWTGKPDRRSKIRSIIVYCVGDGRELCGHNAILKIADLPDWTWAEISAHLRCTKCHAVGWVDTRPNWSDVIDFNKPSNRARL